MTIQDIFSDRTTKVFKVTDDSFIDELKWKIEPTNHNLIPDEEAIFYVRAMQVVVYKPINCFLGVVAPERIAETVIKFNNQKVIAESIYDQDASVIPVVASVCYGNYNLYYAKENPQVGIDILTSALATYPTIAAIAEDLGYILRDENRIEEALEAFHQAEQAGPSSEYVYLEISRLYKQLGNITKEEEYKRLFANS